jgi:Leucine-rich repeat (LRR) protein
MSVCISKKGEQMKKYSIACLICLAVAFITISWISDDSTSIFPSRGLEAVIREQINKPEGDIAPDDCLGITFLDLSASDWNTNLEGIQYFRDLETLNCTAGRLSDISALSELVQLKELTLKANKISDLTQLSTLVNLEVLDLTDNRVKDLSALSSLISLRHLVIGGNPVESIPEGFMPLANLYGLQIGALADYSITVGEDELVSPNAK